MKNITFYPKAVVLMLLVAAGFKTYAQSELYQSDMTYLSTIKVMANGIEKTNAWSGGQNAPQFAIADMNKDGKNDLIVFENYKGVKVYINVAHGSGNEYRYAPEFEYKFPRVANFIKLVDYNCDGVPDLFHFGFSGLWLHNGSYDNSNILTFDGGREIRHFRPGQPTSSNVTISPADIPGLEDIDGDGDLDIVTYSLWGSYIAYYKNVTKEDGLPCDSFRVRQETTCWGKVYQDIWRTHHLDVGTCPPFRESEDGDPVSRTTDGNNSMCLVDIDGDGDFDFLDGNQQFSDAQLLINGKAQNPDPNAKDSIIAQDTLWQRSGHQLYMPKFPAAFWLDIDQDEDRDLLFSPKLDNAENYKCIALYENTGTVNAPVFTYRTDSFLMETMVDLGTSTYPVLYDYDKDGLQDLLVGTLGRYMPAVNENRSRIVYYRNTGTATEPVFTLQNDNLLDLESMNLQGAAIAIGDLDNDGLDELLIGRTKGNISFFRNNAASGSVQPDWTLWQKEMTDAAGKIIRANNSAAPVIYDVDKDGIKDLVCGSEIGYLYYYKNQTTTPGSVLLTKQADSLGKIKIWTYQNASFAAPFIGKIDNSGKEYLMVGCKDGTIQRWEGIDSGDPNKTYTMLDTFYSDIHIKGAKAVPCFGNIDGGDKYELIIGNDLGGLNLYRQVWNVDVKDVAAKSNQLSLYPNPTGDVLNIGLAGNVLPAKSIVKIYSSMGQLVNNLSMEYSNNAWRVNVSALPTGMYLCSVYYNGVMHTAKFNKN